MLSFEGFCSILILKKRNGRDSNHTLIRLNIAVLVTFFSVGNRLSNRIAYVFFINFELES